MAACRQADFAIGFGGYVLHHHCRLLRLTAFDEFLTMIGRVKVFRPAPVNT